MQARLEEPRSATGDHRRHARRQKELVGLIDGVRESARGKSSSSTSNGGAIRTARGRRRPLGFWRAVEEVWPRTRPALLGAQDRHILNKLPKSQQSKAAAPGRFGWPRPKDALRRVRRLHRNLGRQIRRGAVECLIRIATRCTLLRFPADTGSICENTGSTPVRFLQVFKSGAVAPSVDGIDAPRTCGGAFAPPSEVMEALRKGKTPVVPA